MRIVTYKRVSGKGTVTENAFYVPDDGYIFRKGEEEKSAIPVDEICGWEELLIPPEPEPDISDAEALNIILGGTSYES